MSRQLTKAVISRDLPQALELLTSSTNEEVQACYPIIDVLHHAVRRGRDTQPQEKLLLMNDLNISTAADSSSAAGQEMPPESPSPQSANGGSPDSNLSRKSAKTLLEAMLAGAFIGSAEAVDQALRSGADVTACESSGRNVLHYCCTGGHAVLLGKVLKKLKKVCKGDQERFAEVLNKRDGNGWSPLAVAICRTHVACVSELINFPEAPLDFLQQLEHSCPPSLGYERSKSNMLHMAAIQGNPEIIAKLADHIALEELDSQKRNLFHYLAATRNQDGGIAAITNLLTIDRTELLLLKDSHNRTPLFCSAAYGNSEIMLAFIRHFHQYRRESFSLKNSLMADVDSWTMSALQVAYLKRQYQVIDKIGTIWSVYRSEESDDETFSSALRNFYEPSLDSSDGLSPRTKDESKYQQMVPQMLLKHILENQSVWSNWLLHDLTASELTCYELICTLVKLGVQNNDRYAVIRAIRHSGVDLVYQTLCKALKGHGAPTGQISSREFLVEFKSQLNSCLPPLEAQAAWKYVNAESIVASRAPLRSAYGSSYGPGGGASMAGGSPATASNAPRMRSQYGSRMSSSSVTAASRVRQKSLPTAPNKRVYAAAEWCDENIPSFAAPTRSFRKSPEVVAPQHAARYESQRLR